MRYFKQASSKEIYNTAISDESLGGKLMLEFSLVKCHIIKAFDKLKTDSIQIDLK